MFESHNSNGVKNRKYEPKIDQWAELHRTKMRRSDYLTDFDCVLVDPHIIGCVENEFYSEYTMTGSVTKIKCLIERKSSVMAMERVRVSVLADLAATLGVQFYFIVGEQYPFQVFNVFREKVCSIENDNDWRNYQILLDSCAPVALKKASLGE